MQETRVEADESPQSGTTPLMVSVRILHAFATRACNVPLFGIEQSLASKSQDLLRLQFGYKSVWYNSVDY